MPTVGESPSAWGGALGVPSFLASAFAEFVRPLTILGRLTGVRHVPLNVVVPRAVGGALVTWVGAADAKPVGEMEFDTIQLRPTKLSGIIVLSNDLVRLGSPAADRLVAADLAAAVAMLTDETFLSDDAAVAGVSPAGILESATEVPSTGESAAEVEADFLSLLLAITVPLRNPHLIMSPANAIFLATLRDGNGARVFGSVNSLGGDIVGIPVITSANAGNTIALVDAAYVLLADDGGVGIDASENATLDMTGGNTPTFSTFQKNAVAIRADRYVNWQLANDGAAAYMSGASFGSPA